MEIEGGEDFEVVPLSPVRRLEKRLAKLEEERQGLEARGLIREVMSLVKSNQAMVDEIVKSNDNLREELAKIPKKIDELLGTWKEFLEMLKKIGTEESTEGLKDRFDKLLEQNRMIIEGNEKMLEALEDLKRVTKSRLLGSSPTTATQRYPTIRIKR
ncbi:MAG: hypothetical protein DRP11_02495 [Candidatus Aenigmatarchaeota archaeon]|nr:MAG: hypothetical protein DRP11_02495 [Candidatus Aenigmarchaeota archaeon]